MKSTLLFTLVIASVATGLHAESEIPVVAVHLEEHSAWDCAGSMPDVGIDALRTSYEGVGKIDAFVVFYNYGEAKGLSFGLDWPEAWGEGSWHDCGDMRLGSIVNPHDGTRIVWKKKSDHWRDLGGSAIWKSARHGWMRPWAKVCELNLRGK